MTKTHLRILVSRVECARLLERGLPPGFVAQRHPVTGRHEIVFGRAARLLRAGKQRIAARALRLASPRRAS